MASTFFGLDIAKSGMQVYQAGLNTTAHNLANVGTTGYSKQTINASASNPLSVASSYGMVGTGVQLNSITRQKNEYYDTKYWKTCSVEGEYDTKSYYLENIETYVYAKDSTQAGITTSFDDFFGSLTNLTSDASDTTLRTEAVTYAGTFTENVVETANNLYKLQQEANTQIKDTVEQINAIAEQLASLTKQINSLEVYGQTANDLRDQRTVLLDKLSSYASIESQEIAPADGVGNNQFYVYLNGQILVDTVYYNTVELEERDTLTNMTDAENLYDLTWSNGQPFDTSNPSLGGTLQALFQVRDGNNSENLKGDFTGMGTNGDGNTTLTLTGSNINSVALLNIPATDGTITVGSLDYKYDSFEVKVEADGSFTYTFTMNSSLTANQKQSLTNALARGTSAQVGDSVEYKGIPYYMAQLNQFVRTFSGEFNAVQNAGYDLDGKAGIDVFNAVNPVDNVNYVMQEKDANGNDVSFNSVAQKDANGDYIGSYYYMTALNFSVTKEVAADPGKLACKKQAGDGNSQNDNLREMTALKDDSKMFTHGAPDQFLQALTATVGVDSAQAKSLATSQTNIKQAVQNRRLSVSGVDEDEEAADLVRFQNMLYNQYKVLSVMDEVYDKLINGTAV